MRLTVQSLSKAYGGRDLFKDVSFEMNSGARLAVAGPNGAGKSTLLRMLAGETLPDTGQVVIPKDAQVGYAAQELSQRDLATPILAWVLEVLPSWAEFWKEWDAATAAGDASRLAALTERQARWEHQHGYNPEHKAKAVLTGLGFSDTEWAKPVGSLSGGWRERAKLARILTGGASLLILDEPTNHLDLEAVEWLEQYLLAFPGVLVFVAHDRIFLDRVSTHVLYLGGLRPVVREGDFSGYLEWQAEAEEQRQREEKRIQDDLEKKLDFVRRFSAKATKARQAQAKKKQAQKMAKELEGVKSRKEQRRRTLNFSWPEPKRGNKTVLSAVGLTAGWGETPLWKPLDFNLYAGMKVALAGPNGCGKSTLLKVLMREKDARAGRFEIGPAMHVGYFSQHSTDRLTLDKMVSAEIRRLSDPHTTEEELRSVLGLFLLGEEYWEREVGSLSGGEKTRLVLATLFLARANFLVLDEPTNHLDLESREALISALEDYEGTLLMVAHDRWLLSRVAEQVWGLSPDGLTVFPGGFEEYDDWRKAQLAEAASAASGASGGPGGRDARFSGLSKDEAKRRKREEAERRNAIYRQLKPLKAEYEKLEAQLETVMAEQDEAEGQLADPAVFADLPKSSALLKQYADAKAKGDRLAQRMEALEAEMAELEAESNALGGE